VLERFGGGVMGAEFGIEVAQNCDADGVAHGLIVLEAVGRSSPSD
jgi:hypothetical protein